ncbi:MAG: family 10 glycosylhydrolase, partial [Tannerella sp.]|nr:family 10 glycosylhydrolase [Tannerella sp.]
MTRKLQYAFLSLLFIAGQLSAADFNHPKQEIRAVWLATIFGLDWPSRTLSYEYDAESQQKELLDILDSLKDANFNTVFVQTRLRGDVIYNSRIEPVSNVFTGQYGM